MREQSSPDFDARFGTLKNAEDVRVASCEQTALQKSIFQLDTDGAARLRRIIAAVENDRDCYLSRCPITEFSLLWVIDKVGSVILALEEGVTPKNRQFPLPRALGEPRPPLWPKDSTLGHPALVRSEEGDKPTFYGRIGGELIYDNGTWFLTNQSGRFGINLGRTKPQLEAAAELFRQKDIELEVDFR